jgi:hypothetical protein
MSAIAQDSWKVCLDKKVLLNTSTENEEKNVIKISSSDLKKAKTFVVNYTKASLQKGWERTILLFDEKDNKLRTQRGKKFTLKASGLKALLDKYKTIKVYTINSPTDPKMKAQVRLRRVHLCTLVLQ